jgi:hypothetical protein
LIHVSFDILLSRDLGSSFPLLIPFLGKTVFLIDYDWVLFLTAAIIIVATGTFFAKKTVNKAQI